MVLSVTTSTAVTQRKSSSPVANNNRNPPRVTSCMGPPPPRSVPPRRNNVQVGQDSRRVQKMKDIQQCNDDAATMGNGASGGSAPLPRQNVTEYPVERPEHVNPAYEIYQERMPALLYMNTLYPHFYANSLAAYHAGAADRSIREALQLAAVGSAPFNQGCYLPPPYHPGCFLPTIAPVVEPEAYMQQHYGWDPNIGTCWFPPGIPLENGQGSSSCFMGRSHGNQTTALTCQQSGLTELALLPGCQVSSANVESDQEQDQSGAITDDVDVCIGARSGVSSPEARRPTARARRGGSGFQSAQNLSLSLFQPHPAVAQVPLINPDPVRQGTTKKDKGIVVDMGYTVSSNEASYLASASLTQHIHPSAASPSPTLPAPNVSGPSPSKSTDQVISIASDPRMASNLCGGDGDPQHTTLKNSRFKKPIMDILQEVCHLTLIQQPRKRPGHLPIRRTGVRSSVQRGVFEPGADPRLGSTRAHLPGKANVAPSTVEKPSIIELETEKQHLLKMLEELTNKYMLHTERLERLTKGFNAHAGEGMAEMYIATVQLTLSHTFGAVKDAIAHRLRVVQKNLGEDMKLVFRAAQMGALVPHASNVWRPQRGLPEIAVGLLRGWLFEHFLHPYPKDKDKTELASQTGLSRSQVSNWFINARVRLWKPMVEEMYKEELIWTGAGDGEQEANPEARPVAETKKSKEPIGKLLDMNRDQACIAVVENIDHNLKDAPSDHAGNEPQQHSVQVGVNELGLIHVYQAGESSSSCHPDVELEVFLTMPDEFAHVDKRLRPAMPLKICKLEPL